MIILDRTLDSPEGTVTLSVDAPVPDGEDWYTAYRITGQRQRSGNVYGNDALQSLMLALDVIRKQLDNEFPGATWEGHDNHGIPLQVPFFIDPTVIQKIARMIDNEQAKPETYKESE